MTMYTPHVARENGPLYKALADSIERDIQAGTLTPGERLPTHRDMADALGVNVSTVTRGYREAEKRGLLSGTVGRGTFVASDAVTSSAMVSFEPGAPGMIEMGLIAPLSYLDPDVAEGFRRIARRKDPTTFLRYTDPRGLPDHRQAGALWARLYGLECGPEEIIVCAGAQHALTCCLAGLLRPGDRLAVDSLTYPGLKSLASMLGIRLAPITMDGQGMMPEALDAACRRNDIKAVYLMPGVHNPTTATMSEPRRDEIARLAEVHDLIIIEDDAYDLTHPGRTTPVSDRARHRAVFVAGLSKSLAAGLRVAFLVAPPALRKPLAQAVLNTIWMAPPLNVELAAMWITDGTAEQILEAKRAEAARRYMIACDVLDGLRFRGKPTGFFCWLELPAPWTGAAFEAAARARGINVFGAEKFVVGDTAAPAAARLSLTGAEDIDDYRQGLWVLWHLLTRKD
ncbi:aminotransferase class I/II-fold pyridoxal phosphate-dependent enzyme [Pseudodesulfovibrio cashew]|uniref:Aminotransferase class I/II-fold pyridoxal phosphate-dependent enzyme n=1 Tax=Pseudodesulfovibrio cashew TaxID=2678688 RepID=A0A6I6JEI2_9BACT|nr:PLP-dependent aminotransferase family protein [Pseudodesulfovibrio cashew]QGY39579.1 aminotransferase class I/II-fold pyridoxal phosphate-dependent enzyme [Pseudodesulfovibrio cashew]